MGYKMICDWEQLSVTFDNFGLIPRWTDPRWNGCLSNLSPSLFRSLFENRLPECLSGAEYLQNSRDHVDPFTQARPETIYPIRGAARYAVEENQRVRLFIELTRGAGDFQLLGELMYESHYAYTECGLGCEATDYIVDLVRSEGPSNGLYGAKMTGGGAGGTVAVLCGKGSGPAFARILQRYAERYGFRPYVFEGSSPGADRHGIETI